MNIFYENIARVYRKIYSYLHDGLKLTKQITYKYVEGFSFQIKLVSFPLLDNYKRSFRTFGSHQYSANWTNTVTSKLEKSIWNFFSKYVQVFLWMLNIELFCLAGKPQDCDTTVFKITDTALKLYA